MIIKTLIPEQNEVLNLCTVCITDNNGGKIALTIIISALVFLALEEIFLQQNRNFTTKIIHITTNPRFLPR